MGISSDAILFYGFSAINDDGEIIEDIGWSEILGLDNEDDDWEGFYATKMGLKKLQLKWSNEEYDSNEEYRNIWKKHWEEEREIMDKCPVDIGIYCSYEYPMYYIHIKESRVLVCRGDATEIKRLDVKPNWSKELEEFCKILNIKIGKVGWWLVSNYG